MSNLFKMSFGIDVGFDKESPEEGYDVYLRYKDNSGRTMNRQYEGTDCDEILDDLYADFLEMMVASLHQQTEEEEKKTCPVKYITFTSPDTSPICASPDASPVCDFGLVQGKATSVSSQDDKFNELLSMITDLKAEVDALKTSDTRADETSLKTSNAPTCEKKNKTTVDFDDIFKSNGKYYEDLIKKAFGMN